MKLYSDIEYYKIRVSKTKHITIGKKGNTYHFWIRRLATRKRVNGWKTIYSRKRVHIIEKEFYFSKETLDALNWFVNIHFFNFRL